MKFKIKNITKINSPTFQNNLIILSNKNNRDLSSRDFEVKYLQEFYCENKEERKLIEKIFKKAPSWATIKRYRAYIQNTLDIFPKWSR